MQIVVANNYGGDILHIRLVHDHPSETRISIQINGFIESHAIRLHYLTSPFKIIENNNLFVKLPSHTIPSFKNSNFKVWYECAVMINFILLHKIKFEIFNNNLDDYNQDQIITLEMKNCDNLEYYAVKSKLSELALNKHELFDEYDSHVDSNFPVAISDLESKLSNFQIDQKSNDNEMNIEKEIYDLQRGLSVPCFSHCNIFEITQEFRKFYVGNNESKIAEIHVPSAFYPDSSFIKIIYLRNVKNTEIVVYKHQFERRTLKDLNIAFCTDFSSDKYLEKIVDIKIDGHTMKNFIFEVRYSMGISFDDLEVDIALPILSRHTKIKQLGS